MRRWLNLWREQVQATIWFHVGCAFIVIVAVSSGVSSAWRAEEPAAAYVAFNLWLVLRGLLRELACFGAVLLCCTHWAGSILAVGVLFLRGFCMGLAWGWWTACLGFGGWVVFALLLLPQGVIALVALTGATCAGLAHAFRCRRLDRRRYWQTFLCWLTVALLTLPLEWLAVIIVVPKA